MRMRVANRPSGPVPLPPRTARRRALELFRAFAHPDRLLVLLALAERPLCVGDLAELCRASQSAMSHQLRTLRDAGLVKAHRRGKQIFYALDDRHVAHLIAGALAHVGERRSRRGAERGD